MASESKSKIITKKVIYSPSSISWVASVTSCLNSLGIKCDRVDVAGMSGYAFHLCIRPGLCPSGPTCLNWSNLVNGVNSLGSSTLEFMTGECHIGDLKNENTRAHAKSAFELAKREIESDRPCVIWGAYVPEFAVVVGIDNESYIVKSFREFTGEPQPPVKYDDLIAPGGIYFLGFPNPRTKTDIRADYFAILNAINTFRNQTCGKAEYGVAAYDKWIEELKSLKADAFGNSYNALCYAEGRRLATEFIHRLATRNVFASEDLGKASELYGKAADAMEKLTTIFPFPGQSGTSVADMKSINDAVEMLKIARNNESQAMEILERVTLMSWDDKKG
jgi:hypothetical protein